MEEIKMKQSMLNKGLLFALCALPCAEMLSMQIPIDTQGIPSLKPVLKAPASVPAVVPVSLVGHSLLFKRLLWGAGICGLGVAGYCAWRFWLKPLWNFRPAHCVVHPVNVLDVIKNIKHEVTQKLAQQIVPVSALKGDCFGGHDNELDLAIFHPIFQGCVDAEYHACCSGCLVEKIKKDLSQAHVLTNGKAPKIPEELKNLCEASFFERVRKAISDICEANSILQTVYYVQNSEDFEEDLKAYLRSPNPAYNRDDLIKVKKQKDDAENLLEAIVARALNDPNVINEKIFLLRAPLVKCPICQTEHALKDLLVLPENREVLKDIRIKLLGE